MDTSVFGTRPISAFSGSSDASPKKASVGRRRAGIVASLSSALVAAGLFLGCGSGDARARTEVPTGTDNTSSDTSAIAGHWYLDRDKTRLSLVIDAQAGHLTGSLSPEADPQNVTALDDLTWDPEKGHLGFRASEGDGPLLYALDVTEGTLTGRYAAALAVGVPVYWSTSLGHLAGWRSESFDRDIAPRTYDIMIDNDRRARLRIDRASSGASAFIGELKVVATQADGAGGELPAASIVVQQWDGEQLTFEAPGGTGRQRFIATVRGRTIGGTVGEAGAAPSGSFTGTRADVLGYGLRELSADARLDWQARTRRALFRLMMSGNPAPITVQVATTARPLFQSNEVDPARDDDTKHWPQNYRLSDVELDHVLPNPYGEAALTRHAHGLLAIPTTPPPPDGYPLALSLNGHGGSAVRQFEPNDTIFWYADAFARRGYIVLALDVSHRPPSDTGGLYEDIVNGDDPANGNGAHPAIASPGMDSDWAEDGERAWDAMRGIDFLLTQPQANVGRIAVTGLSMGGEIAEIVAALDPRVSIVVPAGAPPDLSLMGPHGNHPCWRWTNGDATEFIDMSDYLSLLAPRAVILETGKLDNTYSSYATPYAVEKENAWRARIAFGSDSANFVHDLHDGAHQYRVSDVSDEDPDPSFIQVPQVIAPGVRKRSPAWEVNGETSSLDETLFDYLAQ